MSKQPVGAFLADLHWMTRKPEYRKETCPFHEVIGRDLADVAVFCHGHRVPGFVAGDVFDISRSFNDWWTLRDFLKANFWTHDLLVVPGQHDRFHHNAEDRMTSLNALFDEADPRTIDFSGANLDLPGNITVYGVGWKDALPVPRDPAANNVLVIHKTLWHRAPIYPGQTEGNIAVEAKRFAELGYKIVFSGDNHKAFDAEVCGVRFHNLGAFTRDDVSLKDQQSRFCVLYDDMSVESVYVGEKDVFEIDRSDADKGREDKRDGFSEALAGGFEYGSTFKGSLETIARAGVCGDLTLNNKQKDLLRDIINAI